MTVDEFEKIKKLIKKAELSNAKNEAIKENIEADWLQAYGTIDINEIISIYQNKQADFEQSNKRLEKLENDLENACDWELLERELS